ncbi:hypothetical protein [Candidatus Contubernalis alkaliaceticus]|uniref:hypothetical protein n=1 Tax=Candidatus Contubernalis alkaliaceticus TaxID=338645 RepID=UPI001F4C3AC1|nr:hypothetical protein [Candidatus Contubernalis alkalaceticus]UNC93071.1 hypothetical protein HUE98_13810 [Candidatus Contubernalis alkalaceticus]
MPQSRACRWSPDKKHPWSVSLEIIFGDVGVYDKSAKLEMNSPYTFLGCCSRLVWARGAGAKYLFRTQHG